MPIKIIVVFSQHVAEIQQLFFRNRPLFFHNCCITATVAESQQTVVDAQLFLKISQANSPPISASNPAEALTNLTINSCTNII
jgi:hypothetical protein